MTDKLAKSSFEVFKVDKSLGLVFGYAIICKVDGKDYWDTQDNHVPEASMLEAVFDFMKSSRTSKEMHSGDEKGKIVFGFPVTEEIAKALGWTVKQTGFVVGAHYDDPVIIEKFANGEYTGFSIGGAYIETEEAAPT